MEPSVPHIQISKAASSLYPQTLELAPEGWRDCVDQIARGLAVPDRGASYCILCGAEVERAPGRERDSGHDLECLTMQARRMIDMELLLHARHNAVPVLPDVVDMDAVYVKMAEAGQSAAVPH